MSASLIRGQQAEYILRDFEDCLHSINKWYSVIIDQFDQVHIFINAKETLVFRHDIALNDYVIEFKNDYSWNMRVLGMVVKAFQRYAKAMEKLHDQKK